MADRQEYTKCTVETNTSASKIMLAIAVLVVAGGVAYAFLPARNGTQQNAQGTTQNSPLALQGTVTSVSADKMQITLNASTTNPLKVATITSATKIEKVISQKDTSGAVEKQAVIEVNIGDVQKGSIVTVFYQSEEEGTLNGVSRITFVVEGNIDAYFKSQSANQTPYLKGRVVAIDIVGKTLQYKPIMFDTTSTTTMSVAIPDGVPVYRVDDPARVLIAHARTATTLADIQADKTIFIMADAVSLKAGKVVPQALIILESR